MMADSREPPPLFNDDDDSRKEDDNDDLFTSAVQSPVSEVRTPSPPEDDQEQPLASAAGHADPLTSSPSTSPTPPVVDTQATSPILADAPAQQDMFESCREEPPVDAFASVSLNQESAENGIAELPHEQVSNVGSDVSQTTTSLEYHSTDTHLPTSQPLDIPTSQIDITITPPNTPAVENTIAVPLSTEVEEAIEVNSTLIPEPSNSSSISPLEPIDSSIISPIDPSDSRSSPPPCPPSPENQAQQAEHQQSPTADSSTPVFDMVDSPPVAAPSSLASADSDMASAVVAAEVSPPEAKVDIASTSEDSLVTEVSADSSKPLSNTFLGEGDTTEISLDDDNTQEVSLDDDPDDAGLFQAVNTPKLQLNQETSEPNPATVLPTVGAPITSPVLPPMSNTTPTITPGAPVPISSVTAVNRSSAEQLERDGGDEFIEIQVSDPQKIGDGMSSYMAYKITTKTNISYFKKSHWGVTRRFSDFLGLHSKLVAKHLHSGRIIPPAPSKDAIGTSKLKFGAKETQDSGGNEFIERRRASLERYMNRTAEHPTLRADPDFREFVELDAELPKATQTSALSSAGVLRLFNRVGETVNKMTFKMDESDQWFEDKTQSMESLEVQLRKLHAAMEALVGHRRELAGSTQSFSKSCAVLSSVEEHSALSRALHQLAESTERTHTIHHAQGDADFYLLSETTKDYISLLGAVKEVFHERIKTFQTWQHGQQVLAKKREGKAKAEMAGRMDKVQLAQEEVLEWEGKVERSQEEFERVSRAIKKEMEQFDIIRVKDFKDMLVKYLEALMTSQQQIIKVWETFLPEAKSITT